MLIKIMRVLIMLKFWILFYSELQLKDNESSFKKKKKEDLSSELKGFRFVATLVVEFKKKKAMMKQNIALLIWPQGLKQLLMRVVLMMYLNKSVMQLFQKYENVLEKVWFWLLIQLWSYYWYFKVQALNW